MFGQRDEDRHLDPTLSNPFKQFSPRLRGPHIPQRFAYTGTISLFKQIFFFELGGAGLARSLVFVPYKERLCKFSVRIFWSQAALLAEA